MSENNLFTYRMSGTAAVTLVIWAMLLWSHAHGGVPSHHLLAREDLPAISNWWGGLLLPVLTWFLLYRIQQRVLRAGVEPAAGAKARAGVLYGFVAALLVGILLSVFFTLGYTDPAGYLLLGLLALALFLPIYRAECLLGFVLGMTFTFGTMLPTGIGSLLALIGAVLYLGVRPVPFYIRSVVRRRMAAKSVAPTNK
ncbi:hypothetical protein GCM10022408_20440 [Hymenobacter fastidiosus]|uniref:Tripartite tricarboxylate transporter TctB family protein n=1 Tax=Hymenobacter fastidiosus TaxID=486264 RepID=A0ABP7S8B0_9BACT